jgi:hypothetical protein
VRDTDQVLLCPLQGPHSGRRQGQSYRRLAQSRMVRECGLGMRGLVVRLLVGTKGQEVGGHGRRVFIGFKTSNT